MSERERKSVFARFGKDGDERFGRKVLELVNVEIKISALRFGRIGARESRLLNFREKQRTQNVGIAFELAFSQLYKQDFALVHNLAQIKRAFGRDEHLAQSGVKEKRAHFV